jgi:hypothetical protein
MLGQQLGVLLESILSGRFAARRGRAEDPRHKDIQIYLHVEDLISKTKHNTNGQECGLRQRKTLHHGLRNNSGV